ncbi:MAG TPA: hypothetical protein VLL52_20605 [Anaerolineae bacterium]|nr:hypothetical protein [Anaerolineae bacterium]
MLKSLKLHVVLALLAFNLTVGAVAVTAVAYNLDDDTHRTSFVQTDHYSEVIACSDPGTSGNGCGGG